MKVQKCSVSLNNNLDLEDRKSPNFKAGGPGIVSGIGSLMEIIEEGGFLLSFLVQDALGMTTPRVIVGFKRDKDVTGHYNAQEGFEVLGREALSGPIMMACAPLAFLVATKFGKSNYVNSQLIKRFGNSLKEMISKGDFDKELLKDKEKFKEKFLKTNIEDILKKTIGEKNTDSEAIEYVYGELVKYEKAETEIKKFKERKKVRRTCLSNINNFINNVKTTKTTDFDSLNSVMVGSDALKDSKAFNSNKVFDAIIRYSDDAIKNNKNFENLDAEAAEDLKNHLIGKRVVTNILTAFGTLGVMSYIPKIYAKESVSPGSKLAQEIKQMEKDAKNNQAAPENSQTQIDDNANQVSFNGRRETEEKDAEKTETQAVSFKGKGDAAGKAGKSIFSKIGEFISKHFNEKYHESLEYNDFNFTPALMALLSCFGLILPRMLRAINRAQTNSDGKKDFSEVYEILIRDLSSSLAVIFAVPMLTKAFVTGCEKSSGYILMNKDRSMSKSRTILNLLNPISKTHVYTNNEIETIYGNIDSKAKMLNFCDFVEKNGGDLQKILNHSDNYQTVFNDGKFKLQSMEGLDRTERNKRIKEFINSLEGDADTKITNLMKGAKNDIKHNKILSFARGLNSIPAFLATFILAPILLGVLIPKLTYANTRRLQVKNIKEEEERKNQQASVA